MIDYTYSCYVCDLLYKTQDGVVYCWKLRECMQPYVCVCTQQPASMYHGLLCIERHCMYALVLSSWELCERCTCNYSDMVACFWLYVWTRVLAVYAALQITYWGGKMPLNKICKICWGKLSSLNGRLLVSSVSMLACLMQLSFTVIAACCKRLDTFLGMCRNCCK